MSHNNVLWWEMKLFNWNTDVHQSAIITVMLYNKLLHGLKIEKNNFHMHESWIDNIVSG